MTALPQDILLVDLDAEVAALRGEALQAWRDADKALLLGMPDVAVELYDRAETLSWGADQAAERLAYAVSRRVPPPVRGRRRLHLC